MIAAIALLISGIGIMNIMLVTVKERTREIGIRKAIGAARKEILAQFLIEAFLISGGGAVIGILIGIAIPVFVQQLLPGNLRVPISGLSVFSRSWFPVPPDCFLVIFRQVRPPGSTGESCVTNSVSMKCERFRHLSGGRMTRKWRSLLGAVALILAICAPNLRAQDSPGRNHLWS